MPIYFMKHLYNTVYSVCGVDKHHLIIKTKDQKMKPFSSLVRQVNFVEAS